MTSGLWRRRLSRAGKRQVDGASLPLAKRYAPHPPGHLKHYADRTLLGERPDKDPLPAERLRASARKLLIWWLGWPPQTSTNTLIYKNMYCVIHPKYPHFYPRATL
jgi:hypothetical protein